MKLLCGIPEVNGQCLDARVGETTLLAHAPHPHYKVGGGRDEAIKADSRHALDEDRKRERSLVGRTRRTCHLHHFGGTSNRIHRGVVKGRNPRTLLLLLLLISPASPPSSTPSSSSSSTTIPPAFAGLGQEGSDGNETPAMKGEGGGMMLVLLGGPLLTYEEVLN